MAKKEETSTSDGIKAEDAIFMAECLKHLQTPANIDVKGVANALKYKNPASVSNRIRVLKNKFDLKVGCTVGAAGANSTPSSATSSPRKGAAANRGPIKATGASDETSETESKAGSGAGAKKTKTPRKRAAKSTAKVVVSDEDDDATEEET